MQSLRCITHTENYTLVLNFYILSLMMRVSLTAELTSTARGQAAAANNEDTAHGT